MGCSVGAAARLVPPSNQQPTRDSPAFPASQLMLVVPVPEPTIICTVSSVDVQVPWDRLQCSRVRVRIPSRCLALDVAQRSYPGLPVCVGGMKSRPPFSAVSPTITYCRKLVMINQAHIIPALSRFAKRG